MKRFLSLILMATLIFTMSASVSYASGDIEIVSPGANCTTDISEIEVSCSGASKIIFELDGKKIGETQGETILPLSDGIITAGNHSLKVSAVFPDKTAAQKEILFNAKELVLIKSSQQNFDGITNTGGGVNMSLSGKNGSATASSDVGRSGNEGDKSYKMQMGVNGIVTSGSPSVKYTAFKGYGKNGVLTFDFDIKVDSAAKTRVTLYDMALIDTDAPYIVNFGKILSTDTAVSDGWQNMRVVVDYSVDSAGTASFYHNGNTIYHGPSGQYIYSGYSTCIEFGFKQEQERTDTTRAAVWFDNFDFKQELAYGMDKLMYSDGSIWGDCSIGKIPAQTKALKLFLSTNMEASTINANTISLYENGSKVNLADVVYDDSDKSVTVIPEKAFGNGSEITLSLSNAVKLSGGYAVKGGLEARVTTEESDITPISVSFRKNSSLLISGAQLETGDSVSADVTLNNGTDASKPMTVLLYVRQNRKLRGIGAVETVVNPHTQPPVNVNIPSLSQIDASGDISVKIVICDSLKSGIAYMSSIEIN